MYLKAIEIHGFKSFGEKVYVQFNKGITAIIGPNGSGKSNILDAVLWVLGEQSYKNIRAKEGADIIFSGGKDIKPMNYAEVSLLIDNTDGYFPMEGTEVKVTRKAVLKGSLVEYEYYINDKRAKLRDISTMFLDTGVGKSAYSVIGQGRVERIIASSPKEIKAIIEEAAGIKKYQINKAEALKKLESCNNDLEKIQVVLKEIKDNKDKVEKQANKAVAFVELRSERDMCAKAIYIADQKDAAEKKDNFIKSKETAEISAKDLTDKIEKIKADTKELDEKKAIIEKEMEEIDEKNKDLNDTIHDKKSEISTTQERIKGFERSIKDKEDNILSQKNKLQNKKDQLEKLKEEKEELAIDIGQLTDKKNQMNTEVTELENQKNAKQALCDASSDKIQSLELAKHQQEMDIDNHNKNKEDTQKRIKRVKVEIDKWKQETESVNKNIESKEVEVTIKREDLKEKREREVFLGNESSDKSKKLNEIGRKIADISNKYNMDNNKLQILIKSEETNEGYNNSVKEVLNSGISGIEGTFVSLVSIPEKYERAIITAAGGNLQDIIVPTSDVAKKAIQFLNEKNAGRASFLALDTIRVNNRQDVNINVDGVIGLASKLVTIDQKYEKVVQFVLGNLLVVDNFDVGIKVQKNNLFSGNIVTLSGELLSARGRITGGSSGKTKSNIILDRKRDITALTTSVSALSKELEEAKKLQEKLGNEVEFLENELSGIGNAITTAATELEQCEKEFNDLNTKKETLRRNGDTYNAELELEERSLSEYDKKVNEFKTEWEKNEDIITSIRTSLIKDSDELESLKSQLTEKTTIFSDVKIKHANTTLKIDTNATLISNLQNEIKDSEREIQAQYDSIKIAKNMIEDNNNSIKILEDEITKLTDKYNSENKDAVKKKEAITAFTLKRNELTDKQKDLELDRLKKEEQANKAEENIERLQTTLFQLEENLKPLEAIIPKAINLENIKEERENFKKLDSKVRGFGDVNTEAITDFQELKARFDKMNSQKDDIVKSEDRLRELIGEIDGDIHDKFFKAYDKIAANFDVMCASTLNNSEGRLGLTHPENFDDCGVEIFVKFKNKKRQSLSLLSGGEKSMVAIAFVISIFMYKPSPFTFLDEIEAALDETNTTKLLAKLKEFTEKSQFILITHNKTTMSKADDIIGVTMNKDIGVTKILGVNVVTLDEFLKKNKSITGGRRVQVGKE